MHRGFRAALAAAAWIAAIVLIWEPLPPEGAPVLAQGADTSALEPPYLARLRSSTSIVPNDEIRALWVVRDALNTPESINRLVDFAVQTRFHLLFVQVRGRGDAYYRSQIDPVASAVAPAINDFDPLAYLITVAHREGIAVHAWLNVFLAWSNPTETPPPNHLVVRHPEWILADAHGLRMDRVPASRRKAEGLEGQFISPGVRAFRAHMASVVRELARSYSIDGIHLDYIRYPGREYSFDPESRSNFLLRWGVDPAELVSGDRAALQKVVGTEALATMDSVYTAFRAGEVDSMVAAIHDAAGSLPLSAAVIGDPDVARAEDGQDWTRWVYNRWVDFVVPMAYNMPPLEIEHRSVVYQRAVGVDRVLVGLGVFGGRDEYLAETVSLLRGTGVAGYAIFSYNALASSRNGAALIEGAVLPPDTLGTDESPDSTGDDDQQ